MEGYRASRRGQGSATVRRQRRGRRAEERCSRCTAVDFLDFRSFSRILSPNRVRHNNNMSGHQSMAEKARWDALQKQREKNRVNYALCYNLKGTR